MAANSQFLHARNQETAFAHLSSEQMMKRILLVDNQAHVLRVMKSALARSGYDVETAISADMALLKIRESYFDVLIIDNGLDKLDGQQLIRAVEEQMGDRVPATFLLTAQKTDILQQWCSQFECAECMEKPISINYLDARLGELFDEP